MRALALCFGFLGMLAGADAAPAPAPELDALFQRTNGWIGADGDYSIQMSGRTTLWLFGDTVIGQVRNGKRVNATMVNNSIALQPIGGSPRFFLSHQQRGQACLGVPARGPDQQLLLALGRDSDGPRIVCVPDAGPAHRGKVSLGI